MSPENEPMEGPRPAPAVTIKQFLAIAGRDLNEELEDFLALPRSQQTTIWASMKEELERADRERGDRSIGEGGTT
jgi:hypothetical protein